MEGEGGLEIKARRGNGTEVEEGKGEEGDEREGEKSRVPSSPGRKRRHRWFMVARPYYGRRDRGVSVSIAAKKGKKEFFSFLGHIRRPATQKGSCIVKFDFGRSVHSDGDLEQKGGRKRVC